MKLDFHGKVAVVTGGAMGIGKACAAKLAELGASVAIIDLNKEVGQAAAAEISKISPCAFYPCNVAVAREVEVAIENVVKKFGAIDVLVSNAGIQDYNDVVSISEETWDKVLDINLKGCFLVSKYAVPYLLKRPGAAIVIMGSVQSFTAIQNSVAYVTSKHALLGLARALALDYARKGIRVNCVCPGAIDTPMLRWAVSLSADPQKVLDTCDQLHALGRIGKAEEVADAVAYLASPMASFITGAALLVDGGMLVPAGGMAFSEGGTGAATHE
jgi:NAD(P)-dependent dehydrogenase (short-subunit alcohol dehydrogenase family)